MPHLPSRLYLAVPLLLLVTLVGCRSTRPDATATAAMGTAFPAHTVDEVLMAVSAAGDTLAAYSAKAQIAISAPEQRGQFGATIRQRRGDSLFMSLSPGLGIEAARVLITPDSFYVYNRIEKNVRYGSVAFAQRFLPAPMENEDLFRNLLGLVEPEPDVAWALTSDASYYHLTSPSGLRSYTIDPALWRVVRYAEKDSSGTILEDRTFSEFEETDGVLLPRRVLFRRPQDQALASIAYRSFSLNPDGLSFDLGADDGVRRELIDETD